MSSRCRTRGPRPAGELPSRLRRRFDVTTTPDGSTLSIPLNVITGTRRHPRLLAVAGHHGDEHEGPSALISLWHSLRPESLRGSLVMIPVLNPPAFQAVRRASLEDGLDINRIFPGNSRGTVTERLADALCAHLMRAPELVLSMHGWSAGYLVEPYVEYPKSGKVSEVRRLAARAFGLGYVNPLEAGPGRLLTVASAMGIPIIEVEIGGQATSLPERRGPFQSGTPDGPRHKGVPSGRLQPSSPPKAVQPRPG